jgi:hypothetical protein
MEDATQPQEPRYFTGSHNDYIEIASRGKETLGLSLVYAIHPMNGMGAVIARFVAYCPKTHNLGKFEHFTPREEGKFKTAEGHEFIGTRLNREIIPIFKPGPMPLKMLVLADKFLFWDLLFDWVSERVKGETGFVLKPEINKEALRALLGGNTGSDEGYTLLMEFPSFEKTKVSPEGEEGE